ncbi:MAG: Rv1355c family protein, partial [Polyangiaceae bacterium]
MTLSERLAVLATQERARESETHPQFFSLASDAERQALETLISSGDPLFCHDTLETQLGELIETRSPERKLAPHEIHERALAYAGGDFSVYGVWVYYPWSRRLVHVLPQREYEELRTSRNRNKITRAEQDVLGQLVVGVAGLSVGQSTAVTLALEGVGGHFRLADFDTLNLSNMNRLRAGVHEIGVNKAYLVAREIYEINPYAKIELYDRGITDDTIDGFFSGSAANAAPLDLLFEECDDLKMKVRLRHEARKRKIAVLMETSDRGLFDVERFDNEPTRPPFHGLVGELDPEKLIGMTTYEKVPIVLAIIGAKTMSKRMAASLVDIDATLKTWPQLASAVALGGAINTDAARRVALGKFNSSGRFFVDLEQIVSDPRAIEEPQSQARDTIETIAISKSEHGARPTLPSNGSVSREKIERLVQLAALAPSGGNCQPWRFRIEGDRIVCIHDVERSRTLLDFEHRATYAAFGALSENLRLGAATLGIGIDVIPFPQADDPLVVCVANLGGAAATLDDEDAALAKQIELRVTNRQLSKRVPLADDAAANLRRMAENSSAKLRLVTSDSGLEALG